MTYPNLGDGGRRTHAAIMNAFTPDTPSVLDRHEATLANHEDRLSALEANNLDPAAADGEELA